MPRYSTEAIILQSRDFLESDKIISALTREQGLITGIAKGAHRSKKRFPGTLEPFCEVDLDVFSRGSADLHRIESAVLINANLGIREEISLLGHACILVEVVKENLGPYDPVPATYECLRKALSGMEGNRQWYPIWCVSMVNILKTLGYGVDFKSLSQEISKGNGLSSEAHMFLVKGVDLNQEILSRIAVSAKARREISSYMLRLCTKVSERPLKSAGFLAKLLDLNMNQC
jgi:DNA repair protein RecO (recombination protein O)